MEKLKARMRINKYINGFIDSMAVKCAVELQLADIIHNHSKPMTIPELAAALPLPAVDIDRLQRLMRYLVHPMGLFSFNNNDSTYGLTEHSEFLLQEGDSSMASMILGLVSEWRIGPFHCMSKTIEGGPITGFEKYHGMHFWEYAASHPEMNRGFNKAMAGNTATQFGDLVRECGSWLYKGIGSLVDVGGGNGSALREVVKEFPSIKCIVFDLPHVIRTNSDDSNVLEWVEGDMFHSVPHADAVMLKSVLHDWGDGHCIKILQRCKDAIPIEKGKVIIIEIVMDIDEEPELTEVRLKWDMAMMVNQGGKERRREEWEKLIHDAGFSKCLITPTLGLYAVIEAYP